MHRVRGASWLIAVGVMALGLLWRDCVLIASSAAIALQSFYGHMDAMAPWAGWRAAVRCWLVGAASIASAIALFGAVLAAFMGWWNPLNDDAIRTFVALALAQLLWWAVAGGAALRGGAGRVASWATGSALLALYAGEIGIASAPCVFASIVGAALLIEGYRLMTQRAAALLWSDERLN